MIFFSSSGYDRFLHNYSDKELHNCGKGNICDYKPYHCGFGSDPWDDDSTDNGESNNGNANTNGNTPPQEEILSPGHTGGGGFNDMKIKTVNMSKGAHSTRHKTLHQEPGEKFYIDKKIMINFLVYIIIS